MERERERDLARDRERLDEAKREEKGEGGVDNGLETTAAILSAAPLPSLKPPGRASLLYNLNQHKTQLRPATRREG